MSIYIQEGDNYVSRSKAERGERMREVREGEREEERERERRRAGEREQRCWHLIKKTFSDSEHALKIRKRD
jgi:hypothetical protein